ncbi:hypothetical protein Desor_4025 [Desulfosporosinus orientis DSM 765]|uniref:Uncharacterized protein n=1 Tax=Desulfosporosinus orientis (strain ATCC 19365 / DSM 765 / NCIMB 8382 / VKM B-1628 / Singapore I) TaxID=768706 RepID=G7WFV2_DESOD|nr:hypothetical protein Desor_4025 [Desulfosporosinus orientis DSM 765]
MGNSGTVKPDATSTGAEKRGPAERVLAGVASGAASVAAGSAVASVWGDSAPAAGMGEREVWTLWAAAGASFWLLSEFASFPAALVRPARNFDFSMC